MDEEQAMGKAMRREPSDMNRPARPSTDPVHPSPRTSDHPSGTSDPSPHPFGPSLHPLDPSSRTPDHPSRTADSPPHLLDPSPPTTDPSSHPLDAPPRAFDSSPGTPDPSPHPLAHSAQTTDPTPSAPHPPSPTSAPSSPASPASPAIEAVYRIESGRLIATLARWTGDVGLAEELAQDALVAALEQWPREGVPRNPGAWLTAVAKRRAIDGWRRRERLDTRYAALARDLAQEQEHGLGDPARAVEEEIDDDLLRLVFVACHPVLTEPARVALTLKLLGGLTTEEIARAFLVPTPTVAQRIVRAKRTLSAARVPFAVPDRAEFPERLSSVLAVVYLIFNEGYSATAGDDWMRPDLCREALRLGRVLAELTPREPEVHGLVALMEFQASRIGARTTPDGEPILLQDQDRSRWDHLLIRRGVAALDRADRLLVREGGSRGPYALQAAIAACHATAPGPDETDWEEIVALYGALAAVRPSAVVELNRAVALSMAYGPEAGLDVVDRLVIDGALASYHLLPSVRADLLFQLGRLAEARREFERAAAMTGNVRERDLLLARAAECEPTTTPNPGSPP